MGAFEERLEGVSQATLLPTDTDATALIDTLLAQPRAYQQTNDQVEPELVIYLAGRVCEPIRGTAGSARAHQSAGLMAVLMEIGGIERVTVLAPLPPIEVLMSGALDERNEEAQAALRVLVTDQVALLAEREKHLAIRADEVSSFKRGPSVELKQAAEHEVTHLKTVIGELKQAAEREEAHLKEAHRGLAKSAASSDGHPL